MGHGEGGIGRRNSRRGELTPLCSFPPWAEAHSETPDLYQQAPRCLWGAAQPGVCSRAAEGAGGPGCGDQQACAAGGRVQRCRCAPRGQQGALFQARPVQAQHLYLSWAV